MVNGGFIYIDLKNANASTKPIITGVSDVLKNNNKPIYLLNFNNGSHYDCMPLIKYGNNSYYYINEAGTSIIVNINNDQIIFS